MPPDVRTSTPEKSTVPEWLEWTATAVLFAVYFAYILAIAFSPASLGAPVAAHSPITWGMVTGAAVIVFSVVMALWYTARANAPPKAS